MHLEKYSECLTVSLTSCFKEWSAFRVWINFSRKHYALATQLKSLSLDKDVNFLTYSKEKVPYHQGQEIKFTKACMPGHTLQQVAISVTFSASNSSGKACSNDINIVNDNNCFLQFIIGTVTVCNYKNKQILYCEASVRS